MEEGGKSRKQQRKNKQPRYDDDDDDDQDKRSMSVSSDQSHEGHNNNTSRYAGSGNSHPSGLAPITLVLMVAVGDGVFKAGLLQRDFDDAVMVASFAVFLLATLLSMYIALVEAYYGMLIFANLEWIVGDNIDKEDEDTDGDSQDENNNAYSSSNHRHSSRSHSRRHKSNNSGGRHSSDRNRRGHHHSRSGGKSSGKSMRSRTQEAVKWVKSPRRKRRQGFGGDETEEDTSTNRRSKSKVADASSGSKKHKGSSSGSSNSRNNKSKSKGHKLGALSKRLSRGRGSSKGHKKGKSKDTEMTKTGGGGDKSDHRHAAHVSGRALRKLSDLGQRQEDEADEDGSDAVINDDEHDKFNRKQSSSRKGKRSSK
jgi:hypothetical protein